MRHRRQHTAQHILSQSFIRCLSAETVSVHLGEEYGAVELNRDELSEDQLEEVERFANRIVADGLPVKILFVEGDELDRLPLRKIPHRTGPLRVIQVGEFDYSACGGTHCVNSSEVLGIKLIGTEKIRGHLLVNFLSGEQAWEDYRARFRVTSLLSQQLTCHINDLLVRFDKLTEENKQLRKEQAEAQKQLLPIKASQLASKVKGSLVAEDIGPFDKKLIGQLAGMVASQIEGLALLLSEERLTVAAADGTKFDAGEIARRLGSECGLKGGGNARQAQLGGASPEQFSRYVKIVNDVMAGHE